MVVAQVIVSILHVSFIWGSMLKGTDKFDRYLNWGANECRFKVIMTFSFINKNTFYLIFSGMFKLPISTLHFTNPSKSFYVTSVTYMIFSFLFSAVGFFVAIGKQSYEYNSKLFYSSLDLAIIFAFSTFFDIILTCRAKQQMAPTQYQKYIIPKLSNFTLPALSDPP